MAAKRKAKAKPAKAVKATTSNTTNTNNNQLDQADEHEGGASKRRRQLQRRDTEEKVERAIQLHFGHVPRMIIETKTIQGMTVRERITHDMRSLKTNGGRLGAKYWTDLVQEYASSCDPCHALVVKDAGEAVRDALVAALQHSTSTNPAQRTHEPLLNYLSQCNDMNQKEFVGLLRAAHKVSGTGKLSSDQLMVGIMKFIAKNQLAEKFKDEVKSMLQAFDPVLCRHYSSLKKSGVKPSTYLECNMELVCLLLDQADVLAVVGATGGWGKVKSQLARLTQSCQIGMAMFSFSEGVLAASGYSDLVDTELAKLSVAIQKKNIDKFRKACSAAATQYMQQGKGTKQGKKQMKVQFAGFELDMLATDAQHEWQLKLAGLLKTEALKSKGLQPLIYEEWILGDCLGSGQVVPAEELGENIKARQLVKEILQDDTITTFADMQALISKNANSIMTVDRTFAVELKYLDLAPQALEDAIKKNLMKILPSASQVVSFTQALLRLEALKASTMCRRASRASMGQVEAFLEIVSNMQRGVAPDPEQAGESKFYNQILSQLAWFCQYTPAGAHGNEDIAKVIRGPEALARHYADTVKWLSTGSGATQVVLGDLEVFQVYKWLLTDEEQKQLAAWVSNALKNMKKEGQGAAAASAAAAARASSSSKQSLANSGGGGGSDDKASVMKLFG